MTAPDSFAEHAKKVLADRGLSIHDEVVFDWQIA
jgi:hypothetical protein